MCNFPYQERIVQLFGESFPWKMLSSLKLLNPKPLYPPLLFKGVSLEMNRYSPQTYRTNIPIICQIPNNTYKHEHAPINDFFGMKLLVFSKAKREKIGNFFFLV